MTEFLITRRETFEAVLIIAIVCGFLTKQGHSGFARPIILASIAAIFVSILFAFGLDYLNSVAGFHGYDALFEGLMMIVTSLMLLHMVSWMARQQHTTSKKVDLPQADCVSCPLVHESTSVKTHHKQSIKTMLEEATKLHINQGGILSIASLIFFAILREGVETVLLLMSATNITDSFSYSGFRGGISLALVMGYAIYGLGLKFPLKYFFHITTTLLLLFAAGMMTYGVHEIEEFAVESGYIQKSSIVKAWNVFPAQQTVQESRRYTWNTEKQAYVHHLNDKGNIGVFLKAFFGWNSDPNILEPFVWIMMLMIGYSLVTPRKSITLQ